MYRLSQTIKKTVFNNNLKRSFGDNTKKSVWFLDDTENNTITNNTKKSVLFLDDTENNTITNNINNDNDNDNKNKNLEGKTDYIRVGTLCIPRGRINDLVCIANSETTTILYGDRVLKYEKREMRLRIDEWSARLPTFGNKNTKSIFIQCGPIIFNKNRMKDIEYISAIKATVMTLNDITIEYKCGYLNRSLSCNPDDRQFEVFKKWLECNSEYYH